MSASPSPHAAQVAAQASAQDSAQVPAYDSAQVTARISDQDVRRLVARYLDRHPDQADRLAVFTAALADGEQMADGERMTDRKTLPGHVTAGAFVLDDADRLLQIAHKALGRWLNPGGHTEPGDPTPADAARRELLEETGLGAGSVTLIGDPEVPLGIDVHRIPANPAKAEPEHWHFDFRYAFRLTGPAAGAGAAELQLQLDEVDDHRWTPFREAGLGAEDTAHLAALLGADAGADVDAGTDADADTV